MALIQILEMTANFKLQLAGADVVLCAPFAQLQFRYQIENWHFAESKLRP